MDGGIVYGKAVVGSQTLRNAASGFVKQRTPVDPRCHRAL